MSKDIVLDAIGALAELGVTTRGRADALLDVWEHRHLLDPEQRATVVDSFPPAKRVVR